LFKSRIARQKETPPPSWVENALEHHPRGRFWQVRLQESKTPHAVWVVLPKQLSQLVEEYVGMFRPKLVSSPDPRTLFVNDHGCCFDRGTFYRHIQSLTTQYTRKRVSPHLFRHVFAVRWLRDHPGDFLTLSKLLGHRSVESTLAIYGQRLNKAAGGCRTEEAPRVQRITKRTVGFSQVAASNCPLGQRDRKLLRMYESYLVRKRKFQPSAVRSQIHAVRAFLERRHALGS
jgi:hypothetical protein